MPKYEVFNVYSGRVVYTVRSRIIARLLTWACGSEYDYDQVRPLSAFCP